MNAVEAYKRGISEVLEVEAGQIFLYWKGRVGLYALLKSMGIGKGDEVILPGFTCVVVSNAILYLGATPVYTDIDPATLNAGADIIKDAITRRTRAIILQNTFGLSSDLHEITSYAKSKGIITIEDCTHGFGGSYEGQPNGTYCDAAFYSTQWNKAYSTGIGGFVLVNRKELLEQLREANEELISPRWKQVFGLWMMIRFNKLMINRFTFWFLRDMYRFFSRLGLVPGSSEMQEITGSVMPRHYFKDACRVQAQEGLKQLRKLPARMVNRKSNAEIYTGFLESHGKYHVDRGMFRNHSFIKYPILVRDREHFMRMGERKRINLDDWFCSPLHPVRGDLSNWDIEPLEIPESVHISAHIVNLPTDTKNPDRILTFLQENIDELL